MSWPGVSAITMPMSLLVVFKTVASPSGFYYLVGPSTFSGAALSFHSNGDLRLENDGDTVLYSASGALTGRFGLNNAVLVSIQNGTADEIYLNGVSTGSGSGVSGHPFSGGSTTLIGQNGGSFTTVPFDGQIAEVAKWNKQLDATERSQLFAYTLARYGV